MITSRLNSKAQTTILAPILTVLRLKGGTSSPTASRATVSY